MTIGKSVKETRIKMYSDSKGRIHISTDRETREEDIQQLIWDLPLNVWYKQNQHYILENKDLKYVNLKNS